MKDRPPPPNLERRDGTTREREGNADLLAWSGSPWRRQLVGTLKQQFELLEAKGGPARE